MSQNLSKKAIEIVAALEDCYPEARQELNFSTPFELLIATILAAQCTDARVNEVTAILFKKYIDPQSYVDATQAELEQDIRMISFYRNKAKGLKSACKMLIEDFGGVVPDNVDDLIKLPYVGRKTANIVLANAMGIPAIGVDTHVLHLSNRLGWVNSDKPDKIEAALCEILPKEKWHRANIVVQWHGRFTCKAKKTQCSKCAVFGLCSWEGKQKVAQLEDIT